MHYINITIQYNKIITNFIYNSISNNFLVRIITKQIMSVKPAQSAPNIYPNNSTLLFKIMASSYYRTHTTTNLFTDILSVLKQQLASVQGKIMEELKEISQILSIESEQQVDKMSVIMQQTERSQGQPQQQQPQQSPTMGKPTYFANKIQKTKQCFNNQYKKFPHILSSLQKLIQIYKNQLLEISKQVTKYETKNKEYKKQIKKLEREKERLQKENQELRDQIMEKVGGMAMWADSGVKDVLEGDIDSVFDYQHKQKYKEKQKQKQKKEDLSTKFKIKSKSKQSNQHKPIQPQIPITSAVSTAPQSRKFSSAQQAQEQHQAYNKSEIKISTNIHSTRVPSPLPPRKDQKITSSQQNDASLCFKQQCYPQQPLDSKKWHSLSQKLQSLKSSLLSSQSQLSSLAAQNKSLTAELALVNSKLSAVNEQLKKIKTANTTLRGEKTVLSNLITSLKGKIQQKNQQNEILQCRIREGQQSLRREIEKASKMEERQRMERIGVHQMDRIATQSKREVQGLNSLLSKMYGVVQNNEGILENINDILMDIQERIQKKLKQKQKQYKQLGQRINQLQNIVEQKNEMIVRMKVNNGNTRIKRNSISSYNTNSQNTNPNIDSNTYYNELIRILTKKVADRDDLIKKLQSESNLNANANADMNTNTNADMNTNNGNNPIAGKYFLTKQIKQRSFKYKNSINLSPQPSRSQSHSGSKDYMDRIQI